MQQEFLRNQISTPDYCVFICISTKPRTENIATTCFIVYDVQYKNN